MAESVKVAIRVRPFNGKEKAAGAELCVKMEGNMTKVWNKSSGFEKEFFFDYSYWSHDGFTEDPSSGFLKKDSSSSIYIDQMVVFNDLGIGILDNAWQGYHATLFAYGQTGSGKSYSVMGYLGNKGVVPMVCEELFNRITSSPDPSIKYDVKVSMLEIYNEQIQDLLTDPKLRVKGGLKVRENPKTGVYVEELTSHPVGSYEQISDILEKGTNHRTVAATNMNATSSRAHTVFTISFEQIAHDPSGKPLNRKHSDINLVDLAGSERADKTGATGDRLLEGTKINLSLTTLGRVISTLARNSTGKAKDVVPYRESNLTRILQNALGGNSKTTMIAAISPATYNVEETIGTLRYADQVKAIKNKAVVNETPQEKLIRELREENERLKRMMEGKGAGGSGMSEEQRREYDALIEKLRREKEEAEMTAEQRANGLNDLLSMATQSKAALQTPHFQNLNEDPMLTGHIQHAVADGLNTVGRDENNNMVIRGLGIGPQHCTVQKQGSNYSLHPDASSKTMLNGELLASPAALKHQDRIKLGNNTFFVFIDPAVSQVPETDYESAMKEANESEMKSILGAQEEEMRRKEEEMQRKMRAEWEEAQKHIEEERRKLELMLAEKNQANEQALAEREAALVAHQKRMEEELKRKESELRDREKERLQKNRLDQLVSTSLQYSNEANERASMLGKALRFKPEFTKVPGPDGTIGKGIDSVKMRLRLMYPGLEEHQKLYWPTDKLESRLPDMAEMCQQYFDGTPVEEIDVGYDPFAVDPNDIESLMDEGGYIGQVQFITETLYYLLDQEEGKQPIYDPTGHEVGQLVVGAIPSLQGENLDEAGYESLDEVSGKQCDLTISIPKATGLPLQFSNSVYCNYQIPAVSREVFQTVKAEGQNPVFNYNHSHSFLVTRLTAAELQNGSLIISVFGEKPDALRANELDAIRAVLTGSAPPAAQARKVQEVAAGKVQEVAAGKIEKKDSGFVVPNGASFVASPSPLSKSVLEEQKAKESSIVLGSSRIVAIPEEAKDSEEKPQPTKGSGCCRVF